MWQPDDPGRQTRRALLAACGALATAGCLGDGSDDHSTGDPATPRDSGDEEAPDAHPFADRTATVTIERVEADRDRLERLLREAIAFWNENHREYLAYSTTLEYNPAAEEPAVVVAEVPEIEDCGLHEDGEFAGCATLLREGDDSALPAEVELVPSPDDWLYRTTIKHELGHVLGLTHDDEPAEIMHESVEYRYPEFDERTAILERRDEWVGEFNAATAAVADGFDAADAEDFEAAADAFATAGDHHGRAAELLAGAADTAAGLSPFEPADREQLLEMLDRERGFAESMQSALVLLREGSEQIAAGENGYDTYNEGVEAYNEAIAVSLPEPGEYVAALGLSPVVVDGDRA